LGAVAVDELVYVDSYPPPDEKAYVLRTDRQCGGLTATALVAAARFGTKCAYAGVLGDNDLSQFAMARMRDEGIDLANVLFRHAAPHVIEAVDGFPRPVRVFQFFLSEQQDAAALAVAFLQEFVALAIGRYAEQS